MGKESPPKNCLHHVMCLIGNLTNHEYRVVNKVGLIDSYCKCDDYSMCRSEPPHCSGDVITVPLLPASVLMWWKLQYLEGVLRLVMTDAMLASSESLILQS